MEARAVPRGVHVYTHNGRLRRTDWPAQTASGEPSSEGIIYRAFYNARVEAQHEMFIEH